MTRLCTSPFLPTPNGTNSSTLHVKLYPTCPFESKVNSFLNFSHPLLITSMTPVTKSVFLWVYLCKIPSSCRLYELLLRLHRLHLTYSTTHHPLLPVLVTGVTSHIPKPLKWDSFRSLPKLVFALYSIEKGSFLWLATQFSSHILRLPLRPFIQSYDNIITSTLWPTPNLVPSWPLPTLSIGLSPI